MKCSWCGREQPQGSAFCTYCGTQMKKGSPGGTGALTSAPCVCGRSLTTQDIFCPNCGRPSGQTNGPSADRGAAFPSGNTPGAGPAASQGASPPWGPPPPAGYPPPGGYPTPGTPGYNGAYLPVPVPVQYLYPYRRKDKVAAGLFAIMLGWMGAHKFYLGDVGMGLLYLLFFWTGIPAIAGFIEGIIYLAESDQEFDYKYNYRH